MAKKLTVDKLVIPKEESAEISGTISEYQSFIDTVVEEVFKDTDVSKIKLKKYYLLPLVL